MGWRVIIGDSSFESHHWRVTEIGCVHQMANKRYISMHFNALEIDLCKPELVEFGPITL